MFSKLGKSSAVAFAAFCLTLLTGKFMEWTTGVWPSNASLQVIGVVWLAVCAGAAFLYYKAAGKRSEKESHEKASAATAGRPPAGV